MITLFITISLGHLGTILGMLYGEHLRCSMASIWYALCWASGMLYAEHWASFHSKKNRVCPMLHGEHLVCSMVSIWYALWWASGMLWGEHLWGHLNSTYYYNHYLLNIIFLFTEISWIMLKNKSNHNHICICTLIMATGPLLRWFRIGPHETT